MPLTTIHSCPAEQSIADSFKFGVRRVAEKRPPPEVERDVEAKRQARKQREQDAAAAAAAAKRPVGRPKGSGKKPVPAVPGPAAAAAPQQLVWVRFVPGAPVGREIALDISQSAPQPSPRL
jgi:hypothetical protein